MPELSFKSPRSRLFQAKPEFSTINPSGELVQPNDIIINVSFGRIAATDGNTHELIAKYNPVQNCLEIDMPEHIISYLELVDFGPNFRRCLDWLFGVDLSGMLDGLGDGVADPGDILVRNNTGNWVPINVLPRNFSFKAADWDSGTVNEITLIRTGIPGAGEIGPHEYDAGGPYQVLIFKEVGNIVTQVDVEIETNLVTGDITLRKAGLAPSFDGRAVVSSII